LAAIFCLSGRGESDFGVSDKDGGIEEGGAKTYENDISAKKEI